MKSEEWLVELACQNAKLQRMVNIVSRRTNENISRPGFARLIFFSLPAPGQQPQCGRLQLMEVDSTKVYAAGQKVRYEEAHGAYTGLLSADSLYFLCPGKITVTKRGSSGPGEAFENGSVYIYIRRATDRQWAKKVVGYKCEDLAFIPGKMEFAVFNGKELQVGSHNAVCILSEQK